MKMHFKIAAAAAAMAAICSMTAWAKDVANVDTCVIENGYITVSGRAWEEPDPVPETAADGTAADGSAAAAGSTALPIRYNASQEYRLYYLSMTFRQLSDMKQY